MKSFYITAATLNIVIIQIILNHMEKYMPMPVGCYTMRDIKKK